MAIYVGNTIARDLLKEFAKTLTVRAGEKDKWKLIHPHNIEDIEQEVVMRTDTSYELLWVKDEAHAIKDGKVELIFPLAHGGRIIVRALTKGDGLSSSAIKDYSIEYGSKELTVNTEYTHVSVSYEYKHSGEETFYLKMRQPEQFTNDMEYLNVVFLINPTGRILENKDSILRSLKGFIEEIRDVQETINYGIVVRGRREEDNPPYKYRQFTGSNKTQKYDDIIEGLDLMFNLMRGARDDSPSLYTTASNVIDDYFTDDVKENHIIMITSNESGGSFEEMDTLKSKLDGDKNNLHLVYDKTRLPVPQDHCEVEVDV